MWMDTIELVSTKMSLHTLDEEFWADRKRLENGRYEIRKFVISNLSLVAHLKDQRGAVDYPDPNNN